MFKIPLIRPYISEDVKQSILDVLVSGNLTEGRVTARLEAIVQNYIGVKHCLATTSCTTGLELALRSLNIGDGDEVVVPAFTYPATADVVRIVGATPIFVDVDRETMLINYSELEKAITPATKAVMPVSLFGNPLDYDRLNNIKQKYGLFIVEDAACALSSKFKTIPTGRLADISVFSLHPRKFITTGEGGLVTTDNDEWAEWMHSYKRFGMSMTSAKSGITFERIGTNLKLSDILSAVGVIQMQQIDQLISRRQQQASYYIELLKNQSGIALPETTAFGEHSFQSFCVFVKHRDHILEVMRSKSIEVQIGSYFLPGQPVFKNNAFCRTAKEMEGAMRANSECLALPLYHEMKPQVQHEVVSALLECVSNSAV
jgi:perosamine synthetase